MEPGVLPGFLLFESTANRRVTICDVAALEPSLTENAAGLRDLSPLEERRFNRYTLAA